MSVIPALQGQRQEDYHKFKASLVYIVSSRSTNETLSKIANVPSSKKDNVEYLKKNSPPPLFSRLLEVLFLVVY